ncbi:nuclear transport factor 2 family protein [Asticcacaulis sp. EMRT-3]|uniref:nuclear transport factor 2 family protein n=1 Tax=Asticcacaulis sp. EMRT-3 TaxID=3040349 RepID=UPI0024AED412|nr:nuclear transport factor 2 family protein [Asticcacaulis sp. EMRT-3]MDI7774276.1 nuclear transport factor 2 family protein [Asticcacaulis sp. EMRT-3]
MSPVIDYEQKALAWYAAWNARDAQAICELYADNLVFISPFVAKLGLSERGVLTDIQAFFSYVSATLPRVPKLKYEPVANCVGAQGHTLVYRNQSSHIVAETFEYNDQGLIRLANAAFSTAPIKRKNYGSR